MQTHVPTTYSTTLIAIKKLGMCCFGTSFALQLVAPFVPITEILLVISGICFAAFATIDLSRRAAKCLRPTKVIHVPITQPSHPHRVRRAELTHRIVGDVFLLVGAVLGLVGFALPGACLVLVGTMQALFAEWHKRSYDLTVHRWFAQPHPPALPRELLRAVGVHSWMRAGRVGAALFLTSASGASIVALLMPVYTPIPQLVGGLLYALGVLALVICMALKDRSEQAVDRLCLHATQVVTTGQNSNESPGPLVCLPAGHESHWIRTSST